MFFPGAPLHGRSPENAMLIGVIDSGIVHTHPQLTGYIRACVDFSGEGLDDRLGHGTAVALQLLYANGEMNPSIAILSAKVTDNRGRIRQQAVIDAIDWMGQQRAKLVNMSLGFRGAANQYQDLCAAIARHPNTLFIVAAGNYGPEVKVYPAACGLENVLAVGATDAAGQPAQYSGKGQVYSPGTAHFLSEWRYYYEQGQALARADQPADARRAYENSLSAKANAESEFQLGVLDLNEGRALAAVGRLNRAIKLRPSFPEAHEMLGVAHLLSSEYARAEASLRRSLDLYSRDQAMAPSRARAYFNLGQALVSLGRPTEAREQFELVKSLNPDYPRINEVLASVSD